MPCIYLNTLVMEPPPICGSLSLGLNCLGSVGCLQAENSEGENVTGEHRGRVILL